MKQLSETIDNCEADTLLLSGTFDPSHRGHIRALEEGFEAYPQARSAIVLPHSWNPKKAPRHSVEVRSRWFQQSMEHFAEHLLPRVSIVDCDGLNGREGLGHFDDLLVRNRTKIIRIIGEVGSGRMLDFLQRNSIRHLLVSRVPCHSSSEIKEAIVKGEIDRVRDLVEPSVLEEVLSSR
ncbi:MAG: hypothetical protein AAB383_06055 [Patescibacteria group bacterium]